MFDDFDHLFELSVKLMRGEVLVTTSGGREARAFLGDDGWHSVVVNGRQVVHGDAFEAAQAWLAVQFVSERMRAVQSKARPKAKAKPKDKRKTKKR